MPVLKSYADGSGFYIHASVRGAVITFQTTARAVSRLTAAGVGAGERFSLRLLADLARDGDAWTRRGGVEFYEAEQFEFDFDESRESEGLFPACAVTGTFDDLHLVAHEVNGVRQVELLAQSVREELSRRVRLSVPISIITPAILTALESSGEIMVGTPSVQALRRWYAENASAECERFRRERETHQQGFAFDVAGELKL